MLANLDLDGDIEVSSGLFIDEESHELVLQEDDIFCLDKESEGVKEIPAVIYFDENLTKSKYLFLTDWAQKVKIKKVKESKKYLQLYILMRI